MLHARALTADDAPAILLANHDEPQAVRREGGPLHTLLPAVLMIDQSVRIQTTGRAAVHGPGLPRSRSLALARGGELRAFAAGLAPWAFSHNTRTLASPRLEFMRSPGLLVLEDNGSLCGERRPTRAPCL